MAGVALKGGRYVVSRLAKRAASRNMATRIRAVSYEAGVVRLDRERPARRAGMTIIALGGSGDMCGRLHLRVLR